MNATATDLAVLAARLDGSMGSMTRSATIRKLYRRIASRVPVERSSYLVLKHLAAEGPTRITDLAQYHGVEPSTMSRHASALEDAGLLRKQVDQDDRRVAMADATATGRRVVRAVEKERRALFTAVLSRWDADDAERFVELIERFNSDITEILDES